MIGACEKQKIFQPSDAGCALIVSSNHAICSSSTTTSCEVYLAERKAVEPRPTTRVFSATSWQNCGVFLPSSCERRQQGNRHVARGLKRWTRARGGQ